MKQYKELVANTEGSTHIKIDTSYNLGSATSPRGYYLTVMPVTREQREGYSTESFMAYTGYRYLLKEVTRKSSKAEAAADQIAEEKAGAIVERICKENQLNLKGS